MVNFLEATKLCLSILPDSVVFHVESSTLYATKGDTHVAVLVSDAIEDSGLVPSILRLNVKELKGISVSKVSNCQLSLLDSVLQVNFIEVSGSGYFNLAFTPVESDEAVLHFEKNRQTFVTIGNVGNKKEEGYLDMGKALKLMLGKIQLRTAYNLLGGILLEFSGNNVSLVAANEFSVSELKFPTIKRHSDGDFNLIFAKKNAEFLASMLVNENVDVSISTDDFAHAFFSCHGVIASFPLMSTEGQKYPTVDDYSNFTCVADLTVMKDDLVNISDKGEKDFYARVENGNLSVSSLDLMSGKKYVIPALTQYEFSFEPQSSAFSDAMKSIKFFNSDLIAYFGNKVMLFKTGAGQVVYRQVMAISDFKWL